MAERLDGAIERKDLVDDRFDSVCFERAIHVLEHVSIPDPYAVQRPLLPHQRIRIDVGPSSGHHADEADLTTRGEGVERSLQSTNTAHFDNTVHTSSVGQLQDLCLPIWRSRVVDAGRRAKRFDSFDLLIA